VGRAPLAVPLGAIFQLVEYEVTPAPPLARRWVGGFGTYGESLLISIALAGPGSTSGIRSTKGILLRAPEQEVLWALEVQSVGAQVRARFSDAPHPSGERLPPWIRHAVRADGRSIGWMDIDQMLAALSGGV